MGGWSLRGGGGESESGGCLVGQALRWTCPSDWLAFLGRLSGLLLLGGWQPPFGFVELHACSCCGPCVVTFH